SQFCRCHSCESLLFRRHGRGGLRRRQQCDLHKTTSSVGSETGEGIRRPRVRGSPLCPCGPRRHFGQGSAASHAMCGFTALRAPASSRQWSWGLRQTAAPTREVSTPLGSVVVEQDAVHPRAAPPFPPETVTLARPRQMVPNLRLYPVSDIREA